MKKLLLNILILTALFLNSHAHAQALKFDKPISTTIVTNNKYQHLHSGLIKQALPLKKTVVLMKIKLNSTQKQRLHASIASAAMRANTVQNINTIQGNRGLPRQYDRGMNGVPVLDQGQHGTCTTFANTGAIDALLGKGDYISQLCNLELGSYFEEKGYLPSGWEGTTGPLVLNQILGFGIINKDNQKTKSCGTLKDYPLANPYNVGMSMSLDEFNEASENLSEMLYWDPLLTIIQRFEWDTDSLAQADELLNKIKKEIALKKMYEDSRLSFAVLLPVSYCSAGACGRYHAENDSWVLSQAILNDNDPDFGGHEMIITGYDDEALAIDNEGGKHQGLLILRNSWGSDAGDQGNYYMSYDFFKLFVLEVQKISMIKEQ